MKSPSVPDLALKAEILHQISTVQLPQDIHDAHLSLTNTISTLLTTYLSLLSASVKILEQTQHGLLPRHSKSSAELLHTRATALGLQAKIHTFSHPPPTEFVIALKAFKKQQGSGEKALRDREALARRELELYEREGEKGMRDLARRKEFLTGEGERIEEEIGKLEHGE